MREAIANDPFYAEVLGHLREEYRNVFPNLASVYERAVEDRLSLIVGEDILATVEDVVMPHMGARILDIGCGYGTFVLTCRKRGYDAVGIDVAEFELRIARRRLRAAGVDGDSAIVYQTATATRTPFVARSFDAVTLWNTIEHVPSYADVLAEVDRLIAPRGFVFVTAPNYLAFRREAHYQIPWVPLFPKVLAIRYLRSFHRDPTFLRHHIHYVTNWGVAMWFLRHGYRLHFRDTAHTTWKRRALRMLHAVGGDLIARGVVAFVYMNPFRSAITIVAQKSS